MQQDIDYSTINRRYLDEDLREMSDTELKEYVEEKRYERLEYVTIIKMLTQKREEYLRRKRDKMEKYRFGDNFFGVVNKTIVDMAQEKGYSLEF